MVLKIILKNLVIIGAILGGAFASQQPWFKTNSYAWANQTQQENQHLKKAADWFKGHVSSKIGNGIKGLSANVSGGVSQITPDINSVGEEITQQKNNILQNSLDNSKKFIAEKVLQALGIKQEEFCPAN